MSIPNTAKPRRSRPGAIRPSSPEEAWGDGRNAALRGRSRLPAAGPLVLLLLMLSGSVAAAAGPIATGPVAADPGAAGPVDRAVLEAEARRVAVIAKVKDTVLAVFSSSGAGGGSGVVISSDGYALTNFHVARPCGTAMKCGMADGRLYDAVIVGLDPTGDVALLKLFGRDDFPHAEMADSDQVAPGDWALVMGNPFMLATDFQPTVTYGIISGVHRYQYPSGTLLEYADCLQTDASINPGNSGGPLFDERGRLIGINGRCSFEKRGRVNVGAGYAISINQIKNFLGHLRSGRIVDHATLGARVGFDEDGRVVVTDILEQSDAYRRGLRYDDEIISFAERPIHTPNGFKNVLGIFPRGWRVPLSFRRESERYDVMVRLRGMHGAGELARKIESRRRPPMPVPKPGEEPGAPMPGGKPKPKRPRLPAPDRHGKRPALPGRAQPMPQIVKEHFKARPGYANYYFNRLNRDRVWEAWTAQADLAPLGGSWSIAGQLERARTFRLQLDESEASLVLPAGESKWVAAGELGTSLDPPGSGGLLLALHLWRRLAVEGPEKFGEVYYLGTVPSPDRRRLLDVLVGLHGGVECRFLFDPDDGRLLVLEMFPEEDVDPCEIHFTKFERSEGRLLPARIEACFAGEVYAVFNIDDFTFARTTKN